MNARRFAGVIMLLALLAPLLSNDVPLVACVAGQWHFPAVADWFGAASAPPFDGLWRQWHASLPADSVDWACMPPWPHGPYEAVLTRADQAPSLAHPLGTDALGRDMLARLLHGARSSVGGGAIAVLLSMGIGVLLGGLAGLRRGWCDVVVLRLIEVFLCFPSLVLLLFGAAFFGDSWIALIVVMAGVFWTSFARIVRGELLSLRERDFVLVARSLGVPSLQLLVGHLWPQLRSQIAVTAAFCLGTAIAAESTLSFLGLGPGAAGTSWGTMLRLGSERAHVAGWHAWLVPAVAIAGTVVLCHRLAAAVDRDSCFASRASRAS